MDAVLRNFKLIPCPAGDGCAKANCPWQHPRDQDSPATQADGGSQVEDGPRKRRKVSSEPASIPAQPTSTKPGPSSAKRPVSPPPLKRKVPQPPSQPTPAATPAMLPPNPVASSTPAAKPDQSAMPPKVAPQHATPQKVTPRKPETLNPRHLKTAAPAAHDFRYKALKLLHDQFQRLNDELKKDAKEDEEKLVLSAQELIWLALDEEQKVATEKPSIYQNVIKNRIMTYKRMTPGQWKDERAAERKKKEVPATPGSKTPRKSVLGPPKVIQTGLTPQQEVAFLTHLHTPIDRLAQWGYVPIPPTEEEVTKAREGEEAGLGYEMCDRCRTRFQVFPGRREEDGALTSGGKCVHHPGRAYYPERTLGDTDRPSRRYRCCQQVVGDSAGCVSGNTHVFKTTSPARLASVIPFAETPANLLAPKDRAVCFDCEMGYTVRGMELIRLTATSWPDGKELLDVLVRPVGEILDLNSRYSGVWPEDIVNAEPWSAEKTSVQEQTKQEEEGKEADPKARKKMQIVSSPAVARDLLFSLISPDTPLIGHGLENDLNAVRIVHPTLIDTILLYPHRRGLPMRYGLKMLMETQLNKAIQVEVEGKAMGHDSAEDARAAGELVRLKVQERWGAMKGQGWTLVDGEFVPPGGKKEGVLSEAFIEEGEVQG
ncbi:hypothetical protein C8A01DRAFT_19259 [Parachaetomium inaequale]|uniref:Exonuclease domain-containing protein n=1 Tax=Parachaetomium inaequale TaxID=2588326 RepID=A0AAN6SMH5_9PEZI|nr:hypothetical protein C8A01DRAFT_19259 [Parachaetomium inaequale]